MFIAIAWAAVRLLSVTLLLVLAPTTRIATAEPQRPSTDQVPRSAETPVASSHSAAFLTPFGFDDRPWTVNAVVGLGTPVGLAGAALEYNPLSRIAIGIGGGTNAVGPQLMASARIRPILWEKPERVFAISLEAAFSGGKYSSEWTLFNATPLDTGKSTFEVGQALWVTGEAQFEYEVRSGFHLVITGQGYAFLLNQSAARCRDSSGTPTTCPGKLPQGATLPAFRVELGYAFP